MTAQCLCQNIWRRYCSLLSCVPCEIKMSNDELRRYRGLYTLGAVGIGNSREWLTLRRAVNSNCATSLEENTSKASLQDATINKKISSWGMWNQDYLPEVPVCMDLGHPYYYLTYLLVGLTPT